MPPRTASSSSAALRPVASSAGAGSPDRQGSPDRPAAPDRQGSPDRPAAPDRPEGADRPDAPERPGYRVEALAKGLRILSLFDEQRPSWRVSDLAAATGLPMPTVYRVVMTLASEGYLDHLPSGDYRPGVRTLTLGTAALRSLDLVSIATPKLTELGQRTGETVNLAVLNGDRVLYLIRLRNSDLVTANIQVGSTLPAVYTSIGKLLLAFLDETDLQVRITDASFSANSGPNAKVSLAELREELAAIRDQGWGMQDEELAYGLRSVAAPITGPDGRVLAGVNVAVQARDWSTQRMIRELKPAVLATCAEISALLSDTNLGVL